MRSTSLSIGICYPHRPLSPRRCLRYHSLQKEKKTPTAKLTEDVKTIVALLTYIYREPLGSAAAELESLDDMIQALVASKKYDMAAISQHLSQKLSKMIQ